MNIYKPQPLEKGSYYHIFNRGNNGNDIFFENENYLYFLKLYHKYISPIVDTMAWCLLKNHYHFLIYTRTSKDIDYSKLEYSTVEMPKKLDPSAQFGHLFNAYTQAINRRFNRTGSLFETPFERKMVTSQEYLKYLIYYIHHNPVHHGLVDTFADYKWSSYQSILSDKPTNLNRNDVLDFFGNYQNFIDFHQVKHDLYNIKELIIE
jgi:REP element-mobilizing transposase RayT